MMKLMLVAVLASLMVTLSYGSAIHGALVGPSGVVTSAGAIGPVGNSLAWGHHGAWPWGLGWGGWGHGLGHGAAVIGPVAGPAVVAGPAGKIVASGAWGHGHGHWWR